ncbi:MAG: response regulator [Gallionellaceae bacterium]|jgi:FixJ family two-component response regulator|nr:response regulator [Gallionellaceae bacterium]
MNTEAKVFVVDDDAAVRDSLSMLLEATGHTVVAFSSAMGFLEACARCSNGCAILDLSMPDMDGLALQEEMLRRGIRMPVIFLSGHGTVPATVRAIKAGAMDFLTKPVDGSVLLVRVQDALRECSRLQQHDKTSHSNASLLTTLTDRELEVMMLVVAGHTSKDIAQHLTISYRTVEIHRAHIMHKTGATNLLELARLAGET